MDVISPKAAKSDKKFTGFRNLCYSLVVIGFAAGFILLLLVILGFTVFKPKNTITRVNSIKLDEFHLSLDVPNLVVELNVTLSLNLSVTNPNKVAGFKYGNGGGSSSALLYYKGDDVGETGIFPAAGEISPGETIRLNTTVTVLDNRSISNLDVYSDIMSGMLPVRTYTKISGRVSVMKMFKHHLVSYASCDILLNVVNRTIDNYGCKYSKTKQL
ncbi:hypothetical protein MKW98_006156 [Papaver atlanticum]|uniref:Late embryogenesis abundant protein LEA-2 subgroup domain-containing protein n=1 Tax=Papaver atlanticum TaxID=357466 RepID=A0AAD4TH27_9MAGN|nr:hypothetical protein MKW98_006156 [Papaver atlanticum]